MWCVQFAILAESMKLFEKHEHKHTAKDHAADSSFCACPQIYAVQLPSPVRNAASGGRVYTGD